MHALGNDYLYFDCFTAPLENPAALAARLSDRRKSVGGDGIVLLEKSDVAHAKMRIFNADGSEAETCGNGLRCAAKFLRDVRGVKDTPLKIETLAGVKTLTPALNGRGETESVCAEMGMAEFAAEKIPVLLSPDARGEVVARQVRLRGITFEITCVSYGNPHCVTFSPQAAENFGLLGEAAENAPILSPARQCGIRNYRRGAADFFVRVFERGSGETFGLRLGRVRGCRGGGEKRVRARKREYPDTHARRKFNGKNHAGEYVFNGRGGFVFRRRNGNLSKKSTKAEKYHSSERNRCLRRIKISKNCRQIICLRKTQKKSRNSKRAREKRRSDWV